DVHSIDGKLKGISSSKKLMLGGEKEIVFDPVNDIVFLFTETLPYHPNALSFLVTTDDDRQFSETYYSVGGGFVVKEGEEAMVQDTTQLPFPINTADDVLHWCI